MSYIFKNFGQTQTRASVPPEQIEAMNAPTEQLPTMCAAGNQYACQLAKIPTPTEQEKADLAAERERQAIAEREAIAQKLENVGQASTAQAVREIGRAHV